jgi:hypothetical protein
MPDVPYDHVITENLQTTAELILLKPKEEWVYWVRFLLTEMESQLDRGPAHKLMQDVQALVAARLNTGGW